MAIGEAGSLVTNSPAENTPITVTLTEALSDPVFALTATNNGGHAFNLRVISQTLDANGDTTSFTFIMEEWEYLDGPHATLETINWLAVEAGVHTLPDGRVIEAGVASTSSAGSSVTLSGGFTDPPVVLTSVMSNNDTTAVDSDPVNITATGIDLRLQEEQSQAQNHAAETVGYIAIQGGGSAESGTAAGHNGLDSSSSSFSLMDTFNDAVVLAETQTINGGDPGNVVIDNQSNSQVDMTFLEERSQDSEILHTSETVGIVAFEEGLIACLTAGTLVCTPAGEIPVETLTPGDLVGTWDGETRPIRMVLRRKLSQTDLQTCPENRPVHITAGALGQGLPRSDLRVSPQHRMLLCSNLVARMFGAREVLVAAKKLTELPGIYVVQDASAIEYIHLVFDTHEVVIAEGTPTESFYPGPQAMRSLPPEVWKEFQRLFPNISTPEGVFEPARFIPSGQRQKALLRRMTKNRKSAIEGSARAANHRADHLH